MIIPTLLIAAVVAAPIDGVYSLRDEQVIRLKTTAEGVTVNIAPVGFNTRQAQKLPEDVVLLRASGDSLFASAPGVAELCVGIATSDRWRTIRWVTFTAPLTNPPNFILPRVLEPITEQQAQDLERRLLSGQNDAVWIKEVKGDSRSIADALRALAESPKDNTGPMADRIRRIWGHDCPPGRTVIDPGNDWVMGCSFAYQAEPQRDSSEFTVRSKGILSTNAQWSCTYLSNSRAPDSKPRCEKNGR